MHLSLCILMSSSNDYEAILALLSGLVLFICNYGRSIDSFLIEVLLALFSIEWKRPDEFLLSDL